jgi:hypothetical protein
MNRRHLRRFVAEKGHRPGHFGVTFVVGRSKIGYAVPIRDCLVYRFDLRSRASTIWR